MMLVSFCINYRALNHVTVRNCYSLPRIDGLLDQVEASKYFSVIVLRSGYQQTRRDSEDTPKPTFRTCYGHFEFLAVPFSLTKAPAAFMSIVNNVLHENSDKFMMAYLDDI